VAAALALRAKWRARRTVDVLSDEEDPPLFV
jgi:hypothetical protein